MQRPKLTWLTSENLVLTDTTQTFLRTGQICQIQPRIAYATLDLSETTKLGQKENQSEQIMNGTKTYTFSIVVKEKKKTEKVGHCH